MDNFIFNLSNLYEDKGDLGSNEIYGIHISQLFSLICVSIFSQTRRSIPLYYYGSHVEYNLTLLLLLTYKFF